MGSQQLKRNLALHFEGNKAVIVSLEQTYKAHKRRLDLSSFSKALLQYVNRVECTFERSRKNQNSSELQNYISASDDLIE